MTLTNDYLKGVPLFKSDFDYLLHRELMSEFDHNCYQNRVSNRGLRYAPGDYCLPMLSHRIFDQYRTMEYFDGRVWYDFHSPLSIRYPGLQEPPHPILSDDRVTAMVAQTVANRR